MLTRPFKYNVLTHFKDKPGLKKEYLKYNFAFYVWRTNVFSDWSNLCLDSIYQLKTAILNIFTETLKQKLFERYSIINKRFVNNRIRTQLALIDLKPVLANIYLYSFLDNLFFNAGWRTFKGLARYRKQLITKYKRERKKIDNRWINNPQNKHTLQRKGVLNITFTKRNMFLNLSSSKNKSLLVTTLRKLGFLGRRRREYISIYSAVRLVKQNLRKYKIKKLAIIYKGWNRFRIAVKHALKARDRFRVPILYVKFSVKIPHNGCRLNKKKRKKRKKKVWLKKKKPYINKKYKKLIL